MGRGKGRVPRPCWKCGATVRFVQTKGNARIWHWVNDDDTRHYCAKTPKAPKPKRERVNYQSSGVWHVGENYKPCGGAHTVPPWEYEPCSAALGCNREEAKRPPWEWEQLGLEGMA